MACSTKKVKLTLLEKLFINILKQGPVPHHMAFIMDGNRRYSMKKNLQTIEGHSAGFETLTTCLQWCYNLGVKEVTVYAFSIENFKRSKEEINNIFHLALQKLKLILNETEELMKQGICLRTIGKYQ